ncbi:MAG TPA: hypothetical protein VFF13_05115 [archaeon]|nr:hypothetical protein [archaeon]
MDFKPILIFVILSIFLSGCPEDPAPGDGYYYDPNTDSYTSDPNNQNCGSFAQNCCEWFGRDEFGSYTARYYCNEGLECRAERCVEGPDYQSSDRTNGWS